MSGVKKRSPDKPLACRDKRCGSKGGRPSIRKGTIHFQGNQRDLACPFGFKRWLDATHQDQDQHHDQDDAENA